MRRKLLALLLAAAMAITLLAACGSRQQSAARVLLNLLDGKYANVSVEIDPDLEADLRQVLSENENDDEAAIRAALEKVLGSTITFTRLGKGQQGDTAFDLVFFAGTDPDKAAQAAYTQWNPVFSRLPADGKYAAGLALVQTENGCWLLVKSTVDKAGTVDKDDNEEKPADKVIRNESFTYDVAQNTITVGSGDGKVTDLTSLFIGTSGEADNANHDLAAARADGFADITITLNEGSYTASQQLATTFNGILQGENGASITLTGGSGLFETIGSSGQVNDLDIQVPGSISSNSMEVGSIAICNEGTISGCDVELNGAINGQQALGGIAGRNQTGGTISDCTVELNGDISGQEALDGIVGRNEAGGVISGCDVTIAAGGQICGTGYSIGGIAGYSEGTIQGNCTVAIAGSIKGRGSIGGVVGNKRNDIQGCTVILSSGGQIRGTSGTIGGIVGNNENGNITGCTVDIQAGSTIETLTQTGGIVGYNTSGCIVSSCEVTIGGTITAEKRQSGGIVGNNWGTIQGNCTVTIEDGGIIQGGSLVGGIAGLNPNYIKGCTVNINAGGKISGQDCIGGIAGRNWLGEISSCTAVIDGTVTGISNVNGIAGENVAIISSDCKVYGSGTVNGQPVPAAPAPDGE